EEWNGPTCSCVARRCGDNNENGRTCLAGETYSENLCRCVPPCNNPAPCPALGQGRNPESCKCEQTSCPPDYTLSNGQCIAKPEQDSYGNCEDMLGDITSPFCRCPDGSYTNSGECILKRWCPTGKKPDPDGEGCIPDCDAMGFNPNQCIPPN